jgi:hypothetical protein
MMRSSHVIAPRRRPVGLVALLLVASLSLLVEGSTPLHVHESGTAGLYNAECPLAALAAVHPPSLLPDSQAATWVLLASGIVLACRSQRPAEARSRHSGPRAPPALLG